MLDNEQKSTAEFSEEDTVTAGIFISIVIDATDEFIKQQQVNFQNPMLGITIAPIQPNLTYDDIVYKAYCDLILSKSTNTFAFLGSQQGKGGNQGTGKATGGICFTGETLVKTEDGHKEIKDIKVGDKVYSENVETGEKGYKTVKQIFINDAYTLLHISVKNAEIKTTFPHPFYVVGKGWVEAKDLKVGDVLKLANGENTEVKALEVEELETPVKVYNFEVEDWHTYYVSGLDVLVHNTGTNPCAQVLPNQGKVKGTVDGAPPVDTGKQGKHVPGHNNNNPSKSQWPQGQNGVDLTQQGWQNGKTLPDGTKVWDTGKPIGPNGETGVRVHIDGSGNIHGYPVDPSQFLK